MTYQGIVQEIKELVQDINAVCVMFDGWTDKYRAIPYMGVRISFVKNWVCQVVTLSCQPLVTHTGDAISEYVRSVLGKFFPDVRKLFLTSCHDGAANMIKASRLLRVENFQHRIAHALHLLLTTDSIEHVAEIMDLLKKCRKIVRTLHFRTHMLLEEVSAHEDLSTLQSLTNQVTTLSDILALDDLDDQFPLVNEEPTHKDAASNERKKHAHQTLKSSCPTRWNSILSMIESIMQMEKAVDNTLKRLGCDDLCLSHLDLDLLKDLVKFLKPFEGFVDLIGAPGPSLCLIPLIKAKIRSLCVLTEDDDVLIRDLKTQVSVNLERRLPESEYVKVLQVLDPETKGLITDVQQAKQLLETAVEKALSKSILSLKDTQPATESRTNDPTDLEPPAKRKMSLRQELLKEIKGEKDQGKNEYKFEIDKYLSITV